MKTILIAIYLLNNIFHVNTIYLEGKSYYSSINENDISTADFITEANSSSGYKINLYDNENIYDLYYLFQLTEDQYSCLLISYGSYHETKDSIILKDELIGYKMSMKRYKRTLIFTKALSDLQNRKFIFDIDESTHSDWYNYNINKAKQANKKKYKKAKDFSCGVYYGQLEGNFYLELDSAGNYCYYVERTPLSKGKWEKKGSEIFLKDDSVNAVFSLLITKEGLVSQLVPGDPEGNLILKKIR